MPLPDGSKRWPWITGALLLLGGLLWANARLVQLAFESQPDCVLRVEAMNDGQLDDRYGTGTNPNTRGRDEREPDDTNATARTPIVYRAAKPAC